MGLVMKKGIKEKVLKDLPFELLSNLIMGIYQTYLAYFFTLKKIEKKSLDKSFEVLWDAIKR